MSVDMARVPSETRELVEILQSGMLGKLEQMCRQMLIEKMSASTNSDEKEFIRTVLFVPSVNINIPREILELGIVLTSGHTDGEEKVLVRKKLGAIHNYIGTILDPNKGFGGSS